MNHITDAQPCGMCNQSQRAADLFHAVKATILAIPDPVNPIRVRLQAAANLYAMGHVPRRPLPDRLQREAELVGAGMDSESLEVGDFA